MKTNLLRLFTFLFTSAMFAQAGHIMQGVGAVNMSMGGAATAQPLDISGALHWNPATISTFDEKSVKFDLGLFFSSPELSSTFGSFSGTTEDDRGVSPMPALAMVFGNEDSKHTFGLSAFGISGCLIQLIFLNQMDLVALNRTICYYKLASPGLMNFLINFL